MRWSELVTLAIMALVVGSLLVVVGCSEEKPAPAEEQEPQKKSEPEPGRMGTQFYAVKLDCLNNLRNLAGLTEMAVMQAKQYPRFGGANLALYFVKKGDIEGENLDILFCKGDYKESLKEAGGAAAYKDIDLKNREYGHLTSYAGRDLTTRKGFIGRGSVESVVLFCDDSEDHHRGKGFNVALTGGAAKWRDKVEDYDLEPKTAVAIGEGSVIKELECLRAK